MKEELKFEGIASDEEFMCKFLAHLLNTNDKYLLNFLKENCKIKNINENDLKYKKIDTELSIPHGKIDIVIELYKKLWLPIEAKLTAKDQEKQCEKYLNISMSKNIDNAKVCYLTIDEHKPDDIDDIGDNNCILLKWESIKCITENFKYIVKWNNIHQANNKVQCNYFNMFKQIDDTNTYANVYIDDYPTVKFGIVEKIDGKFDWSTRIWYREINIEDKNLEHECKDWLNQDFI